jgi:hypothetical protein
LATAAIVITTLAPSIVHESSAPRVITETAKPVKPVWDVVEVD